MIRNRNLADFDAQIDLGGTQTTTASVSTTEQIFVIPFDCYLSGIIARLGTAGTTGSQTTDVLVNTTASSFSGFTSLVSTGTLLSYASGANIPTYNTANLSTNPPTFQKGDIVQVKNTAVHSTPAVDQSVIMVFSRRRSSAAYEPVLADAIETAP